MTTHDWTQDRTMDPSMWIARWLWAPPQALMDNFHLLARKVFALPTVNPSTQCHISCNSLYALWINGCAVGRGPNPSFPGFLYYDSYDVTPFLIPGDNIIAVHCYNFGPTMQSILGQNPGPGGLIVQLQAGGQSLVATDCTWKVLQDPSRQQVTEPISGHRGGFKEICDGRRAILDWQMAGFDDSHWLAAQDLGRSDAVPWGVPIPREIPPLRMTTVPPVNAFFQTSGCTYGGKKYDVTRPEAVLSDDDTFALIDPLRVDVAPSLLLDFGRAVYGRFEIDFADGAGGGTTVELSYGESLNLTLVDRYTLRPGGQKYSPFERRGGRYLQLTFRDCTAPIRIRRVVCHEQSYPVEPRGDFACSDPLLNRIWNIGCNTSRSNMQDHFEDAPWREQALYAGDVLTSALIAYSAWGDPHLARKSLRQFARLQNDAGLIPLFGPAPQPAFVLPEYPAMWISAVWNHHLHWDDREFLVELWPNVERCLSWYGARIDERGLFQRTADEPWGVFIDNLSNITATTDLAAEEILYCHGLRSAAKIAGAVGKESRREALEAQANRLSAEIDKAYWSEKHNCLIDSRIPDHQGVTQITNGLALLFDIVPQSRRYQLETILLQRIQAPPVRAGYMACYVVEALLHCGRVQEAIDRVREYWGAMIEHGATSFWEIFDPESPDGALPQRLWSLSHAFCAGPVHTLPARFGGIRPLAAGFSHVLIQPKLADLNWISATVPTPRGDICLTCMAARGAGGSRHVEIVVPPDIDIDLILEPPGRDVWKLTVEGVELLINRDGRAVQSGALRAVHPSLIFGQLTSAGVLLRFAGPASALHVRCTVQQRMGGSGRRIIVAEPGNNWDAAPKPATS